MHGKVATVETRLIRLYVLVMVFGIVLVGAGLSLGVFAGLWSVFIPLLVVGGIAIIGGAIATSSGVRSLSQFRKLNGQEVVSRSVGGLPTVRRLIVLFTWVAIIGGCALVVGLVLGIIARDWAIASGLIPGGALALAVGWWERRRGKRMIAEQSNR